MAGTRKRRGKRKRKNPVGQLMKGNVRVSVKEEGNKGRVKGQKKRVSWLDNEREY